MTMKANYVVIKNLTDGSPLEIRDVGPWDKFSTVTNDAEAVVAELAKQGHLPEGRRLLYIDSLGDKDELLVKGGKFAGFAPGPR